MKSVRRFQGGAEGACRRPEAPAWTGHRVGAWRRSLIAVLWLVALSIPEVAAAQSSWWNPAWQRRIKLTFNNSGQPENLASFPVLVVLNSGRVDYTQTQNLGEDVRFVDADDKTLLNHQIDTWDEAGTSYVWVKVPIITLSSTSDFIYMYYGNTTASAPSPASEQATWDASFKLVHHLNEQNPNPHEDSTSNDSDLDMINVTAQGSTTTPIIGRNNQFVQANSESVERLDDPTLDVDGAESLLIEAWVRPASVASYQHVVAKETATAFGEGLYQLVISSGFPAFKVGDTDPVRDESEAFSSCPPLVAGTWYYLAGRFTRGVNTAIFINGASCDTTLAGNVGGLENPQSFGLGVEEDGSPGFYFDGRMDEVRVSKWTDPPAQTPRSDNWIRAQNLSMRDQFISYGASEGDALCAGANPRWWDRRWTRRREITFDNSTQTESLTNFPVLIKLDSTRIDYARTLNLGEDIRFVDSNHDTVLAHQIELWNEAGTSYVWVRVPQIDGSSSSDSIFMYYGNSAVADGQNAAAVWSNGYRAVWHLSEDPGGGAPQMNDSTANALHASSAGAMNVADQVAGQVDGNLDFDGTNDHLNVTNALLGITGTLTLEAWVRPRDPGGPANYDAGILSRKNEATNTCGYSLEWSRDFASWGFYAYIGGSWSGVGVGNLVYNTYQHIVATYDGSTMRVYKDGALLGSTPASGAICDPGAANPLRIGRNNDSADPVPFGGDWHHDGLIDEARISTVARSADWIRAQHKSMTDTFASYGPEVGPCNLRSIGTLGPDSTGTVDCTQGSRIVLGNLTSWRSDGRGRGDRITINGKDYTVFSVASDTSLQLTTVFEDATFSYGHTIARKFVTLQDWESCIDGVAPAPAAPCEGVSAASLVTDNRGEIGIAYKETVFQPAGAVDIDAGNDSASGETDLTHNITLTVDPPNRHTGVAGTGVTVDGQTLRTRIAVYEDYTTVEWLESKNFTQAGFRVFGAQRVLLQNLLSHDNPSGVAFGGGVAGSLTLRNSLIYNNTNNGIGSGNSSGGDKITVESCTIYNNADAGIDDDSNKISGTVTNTIALRSLTGPDIDSSATCPGSVPCFTQSYNVTEDGTAAGTGSKPNRGISDTAGSCGAPPCVYFVACPLVGGTNCNAGAGVYNLHLHSTAVGNEAVDAGLDLSSQFRIDIDNAIRQTPWDMGADDKSATTAVKLQSFAALAGNASVVLEWRTASELSNLGFHVYRAQSESGPWARLTSSLIPGLGSSAIGQAYSFRDAGLTNGTRYFYRLEDVDASSKVTSHGPVSAVPIAGAPAGDGSKDGGRDKKKGSASSSCPDWVLTAYGSAVGADAATASLRCTRHGDPEASSLGVLSRDSRQATLELRTGGFYALHEASGTVRVFVPGLDFPQDEKAAALPIRRALTDAVVGRRVQLGGVLALELVSFKSLVPSSLGKPEMQVGRDGTVRAARRSSRPIGRQFPRSELATLLPSLFQGEQKSAVVEIAPLRFDAQRQQLVLAKRVRVRLLFTGRELGESGRGSLGRASGSRKPVVSGEVLARLYTTSRGLHAASFEQLFPGGRRGFAASELRLERQGELVGFHLEPASSTFGPGGRLYFHADRSAGSTDFSAEVAYELVHSRDGERMPLINAAPAGDPPGSPSSRLASFETNRLYQPGLLDAPDPWLWEPLASGATRVKSISLASVAGSGSAELDVFVQGASESGQSVDHHLSVSLNGTLVGEARFARKQPYRMSLSLPASLLREGANDFSLTNVADTGVTSLVFLDRFEIRHPQASSLTSGLFEGTWAESGSATVSGLTGSPVLVDVTATPRWLTGYQASGGGVRFQAETGHRYLVTSQEALLAPRVAPPEASTLRATTNQADYILVAPRAFLAAADPLVQRRQGEGLSTRAVAFEEIAAEFGHGQPSAEAIKSFLAYAYHSWTRPSPRYVLLLGDASYDPRNFIGSSQPSPLPALWTKTSYLWTVSDPRLAAVNGEDTLPDLAIGRLPAATVEQAEALVAKLMAWEDSGQGLNGAAALVADNPDLAGDFEADVQDVAASFLAGRHQLLLLRELGAQTRPAILDALNSGLSFLNYVGHGGAAVWASENVWNSSDAPSLQAQSQQPLLVTMNCLNGYFVAPSFDSLSESLLKAEGRGAIASFSPSGLSLDGPAHQYHRALMAELTSATHERLGDAILAAQKTYAGSGLMPELLGVYHLLGDPATGIR